MARLVAPHPDGSPYRREHEKVQPQVEGCESGLVSLLGLLVDRVES